MRPLPRAASVARSSLAIALVTAVACDSTAAPAVKKAGTQVVTSTFSNLQRTVSITVPAGYGFCATPGCGRIEGPVPADACTNRGPTDDCRINLVSGRPEDMLPAYDVTSRSAMPADGDTFNYSPNGATWTCRANECTGVEHDKKRKTIDIKRAVVVDDGRAIIISGRMMYVADKAAPTMLTQMEATLKGARVAPLKKP